jgi:hypothetical protein
MSRRVNHDVITEVKPDSLINSYDDFKVILTTVNSNSIDISSNVITVEIYESIDSPYLNATLTMMDDSGLISGAPLIGQETIEIQFTKDSSKKQLFFKINGFNNLEYLDDNIVHFDLELVSDIEMLNSTKAFSKAFSGSTTSIIEMIYDQYLKEKIEIIDKSADDISIVFPFIKPFQAIGKLLSQTFDKNGFPLFLFETLNGSSIKLISLATLRSEKPKYTLSKSPILNTGDLGSSLRGAHKLRHKIHTLSLEDSYDTLKLIRTGSFSSRSEVADISQKTVYSNLFGYEGLSPLEYEYISPIHQISSPSIPPSKSFTSLISERRSNLKAYERNSNYNTIQINKINIMKSYYHRMDLVKINVECDPIQSIESGDIINLIIPKNIPKISETDNDLFLSGKYMIHAINHRFHKGEYKMYIDLIGDSIGTEHTLGAVE